MKTEDILNQQNTTKTLNNNFEIPNNSNAISTDNTDINDNINNLLDDKPKGVNNFKDITRKYKIETTEQIKKRDEHFNSLLLSFTDDYKRRSKTKNILKIIFFAIILFVLGILILTPIILIFVIPIDNIPSIIAIITSIVEAFVAFLVLPKLIAEYLFDPKEDEKLVELIKNMQDYNTHQHDNMK